MAADTTGLGIHVATTAKKHLPARKMSLTRQGPRLPAFEMVKPPSPTSQVVVQVSEARPSTSESSRKSSDEGERKIRPRRPTITIPTKARLPVGTAPGPQPIPPPPPIQHPPRSSSRSPSEVPLPYSRNVTPTPIVSQNKDAPIPQSEETPVHRSVFPVFNPNVPLSQQPYQPNPALVPALTRLRDVAGPSHQQSASEQVHLKPASHAPDVKKESPLRRSESIKRPKGYSKPEELAPLWTIANGQPADDALDIYNLELSCDDLTLSHEIITFSHANGGAMYTLNSSPTSLSVTRTHPTSPATRIQCCSTALSTPTRQDPLIASLFPKLAGLLALDEASNAAISRRLDRQGCSLLQASAIEAAQEKDAAMLLWDCDSGRFCVLHPTLLDQSTTVMKIRITPNPISPERIVIFAPETETPLLELDIPTLALSIHTSAIAALPSLYLLDTLVTALLVLLLHLHRLCAYPSSRHTTPPLDQTATMAAGGVGAGSSGDVPFFPPPPKSVLPGSNGIKRPSSAFRSLRSQKSTRSIAASSTAYDKDIELGVLDPETGRQRQDDEEEQRAVGPGGKGWFGGKRKQQGAEKVKPPKGLFDEHDTSLPKGTRAALRALYWGFEVLFWILGALVQVLSAVVVGLGKFAQKL